MKLFGKSLDGPPIIVAEIGAGHNGSLEQAFKLIDAAKEAGADAVKIQVYLPQHLTIQSSRPEFVVESPLWKGRTLWDLYSEAQTPVTWMEPMFEHAERIRVPIFASVFSQESIPWLERLNTPAYKIASFELVDIPLIKAVAATGKPVIMSTGMASNDEIAEASHYVPLANLILLHCVSGYPAPIGEANINRILNLGYWGGSTDDTCMVGLSDHSPGYIAPVLAVAKGARMIEKHLCLSRSDGGPDAAFSMEPDEFKQMVQAVHDAWAALQPSSSPSEDVNRKYRRSLYVVRDVKAGEAFTRENVRSIRPANGLPPKHLDKVLAGWTNRDIVAGTPLTPWMVIDEDSVAKPD